MKPSIVDYAHAEVKLGEQGRLSDTDGYWFVCLEGFEDEGPFDTREEAKAFLKDRRDGAATEE